jgi:hypothetical protein
MKFVSGIKRKGRWSKDYRDSESERENTAPTLGLVSEQKQKFKRSTKNARYSSPSAGDVSLEGRVANAASKESRRSRLRRGGSKILSILKLGRGSGKLTLAFGLSPKLMVWAEATDRPWYHHVKP